MEKTVSLAKYLVLSFDLFQDNGTNDKYMELFIPYNIDIVSIFIIVNISHVMTSSSSK